MSALENKPSSLIPAEEGRRMNILILLGGISGAIEKILAPVNKKLNIITCIVIGLMVVPVVLDVLMRLVLRRSVTGVIEIQEFALVLVVFLGLSQTEGLGQNIRIDLFIRRFPKWVRNVLDNLIFLLTGILFSIVTYQTVLTMIKKLAVRSQAFEVPISVFIGIAGVGLFLLTLTLFKRFLRSTVEVIKDRKTPFL
ncbi:MAG: TRAP transporter small permease, partial [Peptococcaceae bacterium]|nr:TRAP transporter small permease [Peptococcaceae bacterium]